jgi:hypothetical protein
MLGPVHTAYFFQNACFQAASLCDVPRHKVSHILYFYVVRYIIEKISQVAVILN